MLLASPSKFKAALVCVPNMPGTAPYRVKVTAEPSEVSVHCLAQPEGTHPHRLYVLHCTGVCGA